MSSFFHILETFQENVMQFYFQIVPFSWEKISHIVCSIDVQFIDNSEQFVFYYLSIVLISVFDSLLPYFYRIVVSFINSLYICNLFLNYWTF